MSDRIYGRRGLAKGSADGRGAGWGRKGGNGWMVDFLGSVWLYVSKKVYTSNSGRLYNYMVYCIVKYKNYLLNVLW